MALRSRPDIGMCEIMFKVTSISFEVDGTTRYDLNNFIAISFYYRQLREHLWDFHVILWVVCSTIVEPLL